MAEDLYAMTPGRETRAGPTLAALRAWLTASEDRRALLRVLGFFALTRLALFMIAASALRIVPAEIVAFVTAHFVG